ncbi:MAG: nucleotidyltransferase substrate binding protein [Pseudomonadota bacterium]
MQSEAPQHKPRWHYRFDNYQRAFTLLREAIEQHQTQGGLTQLEQEGVIQRFEYTMELAWKVMADYLEYENVVFPQKTPRTVIRKAFESHLIHAGDTWMRALDARNQMSHVYDFKTFATVISDIEHHYLQPMDDLHLRLLQEIVESPA